MKDLNIDLLIHKQLTGEITADEQLLLDQYLTAGDDSIIDQVESIWNIASDYEPSLGFQAKPAFSKLMNRIEADKSNAAEVITMVQPKREATIFNFFSLKSLSRVAAVLIFGLVSFLGYDQLVYDTIYSGNTTSYAMLGDGSSVWLAPNSKLKHKASFAEDRQIELTGKAYFEVARDEEHPFTIDSKSLAVSVLGTSFTVDSNQNSVSVNSGKVSVSNKVSEIVILEKGQEVILESEKLNIRETTTDDFTWVNPVLKFDNTPLDQVLRELSIHFDVKFSYRGSTDLSKCPFTATDLSKTKIEDVISILKATYSMEVERSEKGNVVFSKVRCR